MRTSSLARWTMLPAESTASPAIGCSAFRRGVHEVLSKRRRAMVGAALFPSGWRPPGEGGEAKHFAPPLIGVAAPPVRRCILHLLDDGVRRSAPPALALARLAAARPGWGGSTVRTPVSWCLMAVPPVPLRPDGWRRRPAVLRCRWVAGGGSAPWPYSYITATATKKNVTGYKTTPLKLGIPIL